jgi:hypothetical protein
MTSLQTSVRQVPTDCGSFVSVASLANKVFTYTPDANNVTGSFAVNTAFNGLTSAGAVLRDEGRTVVSSGLTFRKVQLVSSMGALGVNGAPNGGVAGSAPSGSDLTGYFTGYIQLAKGGGNNVAPVARV